LSHAGAFRSISGKTALMPLYKPHCTTSSIFPQLPVRYSPEPRNTALLLPYCFREAEA